MAQVSLAPGLRSQALKTGPRGLTQREKSQAKNSAQTKQNQKDLSAYMCARARKCPIPCPEEEEKRTSNERRFMGADFLRMSPILRAYLLPFLFVGQQQFDEAPS